MATSPPNPPDGVGPAGRRLWAAVLESYLLSPAEHEALVALVHAVGQLEVINSALVGAPLTVEGSRGQQVPNPLLAEARFHSKTVETLQRALALPAPGQAHGQWRDPNRKLAGDIRWQREAVARARKGSA